jgi:hypothetical protein
LSCFVRLLREPRMSGQASLICELMVWERILGLVETKNFYWIAVYWFKYESGKTKRQDINLVMQIYLSKNVSHSKEEHFVNIMRNI